VPVSSALTGSYVYPSAPFWHLHADWLEFQEAVDADRQVLDAEVADAAWMEGCAMSLDRAIAEASQA
jgi:hypothetical protein